MSKDPKEIMASKEYTGGFHILLTRGGDGPKKIISDLIIEDSAKEYMEVIITMFWKWMDMVLEESEKAEVLKLTRSKK